MPLIDGLYVERLGTGPPMLCMHGGMGFDHNTLRPWLDPLADSCELLYYDHRGNGRSEQPCDWDQVDHSSWVSDAEALRQRLGLGKVVVFGHSWGGFLAQEYALRYPEHVAGLVLCSTAPVLDYGPLIVENAQARGMQHQVDALLAALTIPLPDDQALAALMATIGSLYFHRPTAELEAAVFGSIRYSAAAFNKALFECAPGFNTLPRLSEIAMPVLLLGGADDWIMPRDLGIGRIQAAIPHAQVRIFERSGHFPFVEEQAAFLIELRAWLAATSA